MDSLINAAARALATGDPFTALKRVALREDAPALALRGIAMAQLGDLVRARDLLRRAARAFGPREPVAAARCLVAEAEIALVSRDLGEPLRALAAARATLAAHGDAANAAQAGAIEARRLLLLGRLDEAEGMLRTIAPAALSAATRAGHHLVAAGIAMRRIRAAPAAAALDAAADAARRSGIAALVAEVEKAREAFEAPAARLVSPAGERVLGLADVEATIASGALVVDGCRQVVRAGDTILRLGGRPVLFALARILAEAWPDDVPRATLLARAFRAREADESHRARLRVEIGRLRRELEPLAGLAATERGYLLLPHGGRRVAALAPPQEDAYADVLALLADGEAWSSSSLAEVLGTSARTVQRALEALAAAGKAESFGRGRACRWVSRQAPGFPTIMLLPAMQPAG